MLLATLLVLVMGLGSTAHAASNDCTNVHCDDHVTVTEHHAENSLDETADSTQQKSPDIAHDDCNSFVCNFLALTLVSSAAVFDQSEAALAWQVSSLAALEQPDHPDRPPNL
jgi:hypothetical protein